MKPGYHTFEIAYKSCPDGAEIYVHKHKEGHKETNDNMNKVVDFQAAAT